VLKASYDPATIAAGYENAGAAAVSVLTEPTFFDGALEHLAAVRLATDVPILRKDFIVDRYQIFESRAAGADAVLLIAAALTPFELRHLHREARDAGLDVLVEVHDRSELQAAIDCGASIIGVNNRDLRTLVVNTELSVQAVELIPETVIAVAESGLKTMADLQRLKSAGYDAFLIGETLMTTDDPGKTLAGILGERAA
jgi:indole-3-glycerol phosphate synthase